MSDIKPLKVLPCPIHGGKHPYQDHRWIATADAVVEPNEQNPDDWRLAQGSLIAMMRDVDPGYAKLFASAPELWSVLNAIRVALKFKQLHNLPDLLPRIEEVLGKAQDN